MVYTAAVLSLSQGCCVGCQNASELILERFVAIKPVEHHGRCRFSAIVVTTFLSVRGQNETELILARFCQHGKNSFVGELNVAGTDHDTGSLGTWTTYSGG